MASQITDLIVSKVADSLHKLHFIYRLEHNQSLSYNMEGYRIIQYYYDNDGDIVDWNEHDHIEASFNILTCMLKDMMTLLDQEQYMADLILLGKFDPTSEEYYKKLMEFYYEGVN